jgi:ATP-dependent DNA ligase
MGLEVIVSKRTNAPYRRRAVENMAQVEDPASEAMRRSARRKPCPN